MKSNSLADSTGIDEYSAQLLGVSGGACDRRSLKLLELSRILDEAASIIQQIQLDVSAEPRHMEAVKPEPAAPTLLTVRDVADLLSVSSKTVRRWREEGKLPPALQIGGVVRWRASDFTSWIEDQVA